MVIELSFVCMDQLILVLTCSNGADIRSTYLCSSFDIFNTVRSMFVLGYPTNPFVSLSLLFCLLLQLNDQADLLTYILIPNYEPKYFPPGTKTECTLHRKEKANSINVPKDTLQPSLHPLLVFVSRLQFILKI